MRKRIFEQLTPECEKTVLLYAQGYEKKEIAEIKSRAVSTVSNQIQKAFQILHVRNGRELATLLSRKREGFETVKKAASLYLLVMMMIEHRIRLADVANARRQQNKRRYGTEQSSSHVVAAGNRSYVTKRIAANRLRCNN